MIPARITKRRPGSRLYEYRVPETRVGKRAAKPPKRPKRKAGLLDDTGKLVVPPRYDSCERTAGDLYHATDWNQHVYLDEAGKELFRRPQTVPVTFGPDSIGVSVWGDVATQRTRVAFVTPQGVMTPIDADDAGPPAGGLAAAQRDRASKTWGYVDARGSWQIEPAFPAAGAFDGDLAPAGDRRGRWGLIDRGGAWVRKPAFAAIAAAGDGRFTVMDDDERWGLVARDGSVVVRPRFTRPLRFSDGVAAAAEPGAPTGYIDDGGAWAIEPAFVDAHEMLAGVAPVAIAGKALRPKWGLVTRAGKTVVPPTYAWLRRVDALFCWTGPYRRTRPIAWGYVSPAGAAIWSGER